MAAPMSKVNRDAIAREALAVLDEDGIDALSMRALADRLGIGTMTLYGYFRSKEELLDAAVGAAVDDFVAPRRTGRFRDDARAVTLAVRDVLVKHPTLPRVRGQEPLLQPRAFRMSEEAMQVLLDAGFPLEEAGRAFRVLFTYVFGEALFSPHEPAPADRRAARAALLTLPEDEFPAMTRVADGMAEALGGPEQFAYGLERVLDGLEARLRELNAGEVRDAP